MASLAAALVLVLVVGHITQRDGMIPLVDDGTFIAPEHSGLPPGRTYVGRIQPVTRDAIPIQAMPPTYLSGVVTYAPDGRFAKLLMGATRFLSCRDALDDTESAIAKAQERQPPGARTEGVCFPLHTYNYDDVTSVKAGPKSPET